MYFVYLLLSKKDKKLYTGYSTNVHKRLKRHNAGGTQSTRDRRPYVLIFYEAYINKGDALRREKYLKTTAGKKAIKIMLKNTLIEKHLHAKNISTKETKNRK